ncbi:type II secretion system protein [Terriglobus saanensis]|uniref:Type II secretion system protein G n=1 Tax=Terriglobus saanensis (strain ATCC BAA-1853 / DSM 23119 / SP1PR4) TaxID=401053 RepID=E8V0T9_TERSS|nr:prepilin-type N-terminal cleavage/methylation domain-containing protein [Terriglobus saanensis]ADV82230.1 type II secretion system protein G [Terriglobus saanensis SP1PR4]
MVKRRKSEAGFTLLELMVVMIIIGVLAAIAIPAYLTQIKRAKEAVLREDLHVMRQAIDQYTVDKQKAPQSLDDLVQTGYMKTLPTDPLTNRADTWVTEQSDSYSSVDQTESGGMNNVRSGAGGLATDGSIYSSW